MDKGNVHSCYRFCISNHDTNGYDYVRVYTSEYKQADFSDPKELLDTKKNYLIQSLFFLFMCQKFSIDSSV